MASSHRFVELVLSSVAASLLLCCVLLSVLVLFVMVVITRLLAIACGTELRLVGIAVGGAVRFDTPSSHTHGGWSLVFGGWLLLSSMNPDTAMWCHAVSIYAMQFPALGMRFGDDAGSPSISIVATPMLVVVLVVVWWWWWWWWWWWVVVGGGGGWWTDWVWLGSCCYSCSLRRIS